VNDDAAMQLVPRYRQRGLLLDTNLLLIWLVGQHRPAWIGKRRKLEAYNADDLRRLRGFVGRFDQLLVTPAILAEVSNLALYTAYDHERADLLRAFQALINVLAERQPPSMEVADLPSFAWLGLPDATIEHIAKWRRAFILSHDLDLVQQLQGQNLAALNFAYLRSQ